MSDKLHQSIKDRIGTLSSFISMYADIRYSGKSAKCLCPFHDEHTPSFFIDDERGTWVCYGACHARGDIFDFCERKFGMTHRESVRFLAEKAGVKLDDEPEPSPYHVAIIEYLSLYCDDTSDILSRFILGKKLNPEVIKRYGLSFSSVSHARPTETSLEYLIKMGLLSSDGHNLHKNRIVIPIKSLSGEYIAVASRSSALSNENAPKYLNTNETPVFKKRHTLYGLRLGLVNRESYVVLVEGYFDAIALNESGIPAAAVMSGSATPEQVAMASKYARRVVVMGDADKAGSAMHANIGWLSIHNDYPVFVAHIPDDGADPDEIVSSDKDRMMSIIHSAEHIGYSIAKQEIEDNPGSSEKRALITKFADAIYGKGADIMDFYSGVLASVLSMPKQIIVSMFAAFRKQNVVVRKDVSLPCDDRVRAVFAENHIHASLDAILQTADPLILTDSESLTKYCLRYISNTTYMAGSDPDDISTAHRLLAEMEGVHVF